MSRSNLPAEPEGADRPDAPIMIGGLVPLSTVDFPGRLAAVVFCQGCPWRCPYCHNRHLLGRRSKDGPDWNAVHAFLRARIGLLDGVVFSGGEPLLQRDLGQAMGEVRAMGFSVALHTGGSHPSRLRRVLGLLGWVGFDVKAPFADYARVTGVSGSGAAARESLSFLVASGVPYEVRTTVDPELLDRELLLRLADDLVEQGVRRFVLQECRPRPGRTAGQGSRESSLGDSALIEHFTILFPNFAIRSASTP